MIAQPLAHARHAALAPTRRVASGRARERGARAEDARDFLEGAFGSADLGVEAAASRADDGRVVRSGRRQGAELVLEGVDVQTEAVERAAVELVDPGAGTASDGG